MVEQLTRNEQAEGSIPSFGSIKSRYSYPQRCMKKILLAGLFVITTLLVQGLAFAEVQNLNEYSIFSEDNEGLPEGVPEPAIIITENEGIPEEPAWTYRYLIPTSIAIATIVVFGNIVQYFRKVVRKRYKVVE